MHMQVPQVNAGGCMAVALLLRRIAGLPTHCSIDGRPAASMGAVLMHKSEHHLLIEEQCSLRRFGVHTGAPRATPAWAGPLACQRAASVPRGCRAQDPAPLPAETLPQSRHPHPAVSKRELSEFKGHTVRSCTTPRWQLTQGVDAVRQTARTAAAPASSSNPLECAAFGNFQIEVDEIV